MDTQVESQLPGLHWSDSGYAAIEGELLIWAEKLDQVFKGWAADLGATAHRFPTMIAAESLEPISYLRSFPHLATFASCGTRDDEALRALAADEGGVNPQSLDAPQQILTPAACYHFYHRLAGSDISATAYMTTRCQCHRCEDYYLPLQRQWCFEMREIVCIGDRESIERFTAHSRSTINSFVERLGIDTSWEVATDPFFDPAADPKALAQILEPSKHELCLDNGLAIASINEHRSFFGECYDITMGGKPIHSACVAFGIERWLFAMASTFGNDIGDWPTPGGDS